jgi:hypothetical protein
MVFAAAVPRMRRQPLNAAPQAGEQTRPAGGSRPTEPCVEILPSASMQIAPWPARK